MSQERKVIYGQCKQADTQTLKAKFEKLSKEQEDKINNSSHGNNNHVGENNNKVRSPTSPSIRPTSMPAQYVRREEQKASSLPNSPVAASTRAAAASPTTKNNNQQDGNVKIANANRRAMKIGSPLTGSSEHRQGIQLQNPRMSLQPTYIKREREKPTKERIETEVAQLVQEKKNINNNNKKETNNSTTTAQTSNTASTKTAVATETTTTTTNTPPGIQSIIDNLESQGQYTRQEIIEAIRELIKTLSSILSQKDNPEKCAETYIVSPDSKLFNLYFQVSKISPLQKILQLFSFESSPDKKQFSILANNISEQTWLPLLSALTTAAEKLHQNIQTEAQKQGRHEIESSTTKANLFIDKFEPSLRFKVGFADRRGRRRLMEDAAMLLGCYQGRGGEDYFALFDGHGGSDASEYCAWHLHEELERQLTDHGFRTEKEREGCEEEDVKKIITKAFVKLNDRMGEIGCKGEKEPNGNKVKKIKGGTTVVIAWVVKDKMYVANVGDSRAVMCRGTRESERLTVDHKPDLEKEQQRIEKLGGRVMKSQEGGARMNGKIAVSRGLGDIHDSYIGPFLGREPDITVIDWKKENEGVTLVMACDGLWDVIKDEEIPAIIEASRNKGEGPGKLADGLMTMAYEKGSTDNITVIIIDMNDVS